MTTTMTMMTTVLAAAQTSVVGNWFYYQPEA
jgi:hypothetical protein